MSLNAERIDSLRALRRLIAAPPALMQKRLQPRLDEHCLAILAKASLCVCAFPDPLSGMQFLNLRQAPILAAAEAQIVFVWPAGKPVSAALQAGEQVAVSLYFIISGIGFGMRANGHCRLVRQAAGWQLLFSAQAFFMHCSRAKVRAQFWQARPPHTHWQEEAERAQLTEMAQAFIARSPYLLLQTQNQAGDTELSPRGDPDGFVQVLDRQTLLIPERPGNKVACSLSNILEHGAVNVALLIPGAEYVLFVSGRAWLTREREVLTGSAVNGKVPLLGIVVEVQRQHLARCPALVQAGLWQAESHVSATELPSFAKILGEHMNGNGLLGKATTLLVDTVVKHDLKHLY